MSCVFTVVDINVSRFLIGRSETTGQSETSAHFNSHDSVDLGPRHTCLILCQQKVASNPRNTQSLRKDVCNLSTRSIFRDFEYYMPALSNHCKGIMQLWNVGCNWPCAICMNALNHITAGPYITCIDWNSSSATYWLCWIKVPCPGSLSSLKKDSNNMIYICTISISRDHKRWEHNFIFPWIKKS